GGEGAGEHVVLEVHPRPVLLHTEPLHALPYQPVEEVDERPQGADVPAEAAREEEPREQHGTGEAERPYPGAGGDRGGDGEEGVAGEEHRRMDELAPGPGPRVVG